MSFTKAAAFAPATVANLGVGFDVLGLALNEPGDIVIAERRDTPGAAVRLIENDGGILPYEAKKNTACVAAESALRLIGAPSGVWLTIQKGLPAASGLGSSAASAVAAAVAVNALFGEPVEREALLPACLDGEAVASGYHPDNVAPALLGGITLATGLTPAQIHRVPVPERLHLALVTPNIAVPTAEARAVLPKLIPLKAMVTQTASVAYLIHTIYSGDVVAMGQAMERDGIIEPARAHLMPLLDEARVAAKANGAHGLVISGAGPSLCAVCDDGETAARVADALRHVYDSSGIGCKAFATRVNESGARVVATE
ncbi:MAG: homoserine kinase [Chloroflexota bacterium]|nr:homoserine kinase [Chloroflexota bacterium]